MPGTNNNNNQHSDEPLDPRMLEQLNAYLDYELSEEQRTQVRDLLRRSPAADNEMATLKATSKVLSELPPVPAPRSFAVRPAMLEQPAKSGRGFNLFGWMPSPSFALSLGSLAAACLLVLVLTAQLVSGSGNHAQGSVVTASIAPPTPSGQSGTGQAYNNYDNGRTAPSNPPVSAAAAQPTATTAAAVAPAPAMATAPTPTAVAVTSSMVMSATNASSGSSATSGAGAAPSAITPRLGYAPVATPPGTPGTLTNNYYSGATATNPSTSTYAFNAKSGVATAAPSNNQANNPAANGSGISASGPLPNQNTNQTNNYNVLSGSMDYWLVIEIALAILAVALGLGALIAQRRSR